MLTWSDRVIVNSDALRRQIFEQQEDDTVRVVWNGVEPVVNMDVQRLDLEDVPSGVPLTAICGRLQARKGIPDYLAAVVLLQQDHPDAHHLVIGAGQPEYLSRLQAEVDRLGLAERVHFLGYRRDARALMAGVDILVSAAVQEPFGRSLIEAMAAGVPVVATRSGGPEEIVDDGVSGYLVDVGDVVAMAGKIAHLLGDSEHALALGLAGRQRVLDNV